VSFLFVVLLIISGSFALIQIPKESSPNIKFGIVLINTIYPGANPLDVDSIVTEKIYKEVKDIQWIDKIDASSSQWVSSVTITLDNGISVKDFINDVRTKVDVISFPDDVKRPVIKEIWTDNEVLFQMVMYGDKNYFTMNSLRSLAMEFRSDIINKASIVDVVVDGIDDDNDYDVQVLLDKGKLENYWISVSDVTNQIRSYNQNLPLGNHALGELTYDYRISNEINTLKELEGIPIVVSQSQDNILLSDLAIIKRKYKNTSISYGWKQWVSNQYGVPITIYKGEGGNIFADAKSAKALIEKTLDKTQFDNIGIEYTRDLSDIIIDDYKSLWSNAVTSILLVLLITALFIWFRQSLISTLGMILSFFITFIILKSLGLTLNFLTNFSLILSFGAWIDTVIVFIEAAYENMKKWFNPKTAILLAVNTYKSANINTSLINILVFIPLLVLPGVTWKFLSYIPITIFTTLLWSLFLSLTVNSALFVAFNKKLSYYFADAKWEEDVVMSDVEKQILQEEQQWKAIKNKSEEPFFEKRFDVIRNKYLAILRFTMSKKIYRRIAVLSPIIAVVATFVFLAPSIGFKLFPSGDNPFIDFVVKAKAWTTTETMVSVGSWIDVIVSSIPEVKSYEIKIQNNVIDIWVILVKKWERDRDSFEIQDGLSKDLEYLRMVGYSVEGKVQAWWPPVGKAIGIDLIATDKEKISMLKSVSRDFEEYIRTLTWTTNISNSSTETPGQFSLVFDDARLAELGLTPQDIKWEIYAMVLGLKAWVMALDSIDRDIVVKVADLEDAVSPDVLSSLVISTRAWDITLGSIARIDIQQSLASIARKDGNINITVEADLKEGLAPTSFQPLLLEYAKKYDFPEGIVYKEAWENEANKDLIQSTIMAFFVSLLLAFGVLVYQFNSFSKPAMVLYSIITALLGVNLGLWFTWNPYSMAFAIWFISLIGVVVNTAIFLVDRIKYNLEHGANIEHAIYEAWYVRFKPILISTITTVLWLWSVVTQDEFYATLWYTVIFGLIFSAAITLIALPNLYYSLYMKQNPTIDAIKEEW
jgi:multidrug efflux pump subunit AcrB